MIFWIIIGAAFYNLANKYGKNKWVYLAIGIGLTLLVQLAVGFIWGVAKGLSKSAGFPDNDIVVNLVALLISGIITYIVYRRLKMKAEREYDEREEAIQSFGADIDPETLVKNEQDS